MVGTIFGEKWSPIPDNPKNNYTSVDPKYELSGFIGEISTATTKQKIHLA